MATFSFGFFSTIFMAVKKPAAPAPTAQPAAQPAQPAAQPAPAGGQPSAAPAQ